MDKKKIETVTSRADAYLRQGRLRDALETLRALSEEGMQWEVSDKLNQIGKNYAYMLRYLTDGMPDPDRDKIYGALISDTYMASDTLSRRLLMRDCPTLYFNTLRNLGVRPRNMAAVIGDYLALAGRSNNIVEQITSGASPMDLRQVERAERDIFNYIWTVYPLGAADADALSAFLNDELMPMRTKLLAVNALALGALEYFDPARIIMLMNIYDNESSDIHISSVALVGLLLALFRFHERPLPDNVADRLMLLSDGKTWHSDLKTAFLELIRTRDTERINRTMREDIIPGMMKMRPDIIRKMEDASFDPENPEANPEWEEMLRKSGIADRIRDLSELQQEGADVFMSTFSHLKSFPFFNDMANWFMPFDVERVDVAEAGMPPVVTSMLEKLPILCDSDKYSFILSIGSVPESQRRMMLSQFESQNATQMEEMMRAEAGMHPVVRRTAVSAFLQNLYRFLFLFRRKGDFYNPFAEGVNLLKVNALSPYLNDAETVEVVAEFFFRCKYWDDALQAFLRLDSISDPRPEVFQKIGYCYQKHGNTDKAIEYYHQAEYFAPDNAWLLRRLGAAYRLKGDYAQAADYYKRLADKGPDDIDTTLTIGYVLMQAKDYQGALKQFFKAEFMDEAGTKAFRPLAWALFVTGDFDKSAAYYNKVMQDNPTANDYLNMGHVAMARAAYKEAVNYYKLSMNKADGGVETLIRNIRNDADALRDAGVDDRTVSLVIDAMLYSI